MDSEFGTWIESSAIVQNSDKNITLAASEIDSRGNVLSKPMATVCRKIASDMHCSMKNYFGPGKRTIRTRFISFNEEPLVLVKAELRSWSADRSTPEANRKEFARILRWMKDIYWKSDKTDWVEALTAGRMALKAPPSVNPVPWAVNRMLVLLPDNEHSFVHGTLESPVKVDIASDVPMPSCAHPSPDTTILQFPETPKTKNNQIEYIRLAHRCLAGVGTNETVWIDLQSMEGGNAFTLFASLRPLFDDGPLVNFINGQGQTNVLSYSANNLVSSGKRVYTWASSPPKMSNSIKILVGPSCISACETVAIAAIERLPLYGRATGGFTTANEALPLPGNFLLALTAGTTATRFGKTIYPNVQPDQVLSEAEIEEIVKGGSAK